MNTLWNDYYQLCISVSSLLFNKRPHWDCKGCGAWVSNDACSDGSSVTNGACSDGACGKVAAAGAAALRL